MARVRLAVLKIAGALLLVLVAASLSWAQVSSTVSTALIPTPGAGHDYVHMLNEIVMPLNGQASVRVNLDRPLGRHLNLPPLMIKYDSNTAHAPWQGPPTEPIYVQPTGGGWTSVSNGFPVLSYDEGTDTSVVDGDGNPVSCPYRGNYTFIDSSGKRYPFSNG